MLAWLGRRLADTRFQLLALAYLILAVAYTLIVEAQPDVLYTRGADYFSGVPALLAVAAGAAAYGSSPASGRRRAGWMRCRRSCERSSRTCTSSALCSPWAR
jgi:hypothetical protein